MFFAVETMAVIASKNDRSLPSDEKIDTVATPELCKKYAELFEQAIARTVMNMSCKIANHMKA